MSQNLLDLQWVLICSLLVFLMQAGFLCLEAGTTRTKNSIHVALKNITDFSFCSLIFWAFGFAWMFHGETQHAYFFLDFSQQNAWTLAFFIFQLMFCGTAVTIISGAIAERIHFAAYVWIAILVSALIYPIYGHWVWGMALNPSEGDAWLSSLGFVDFAGSSVVHSIGGWAALATLFIIGPRTGRFRNRDNTKIPGSNMPLAMFGVLLLWSGWFGFNCGSTLAFTDKIPSIFINTFLSASSGLIGVLLMEYLMGRLPNVTLLGNGCLSGLVGITASCHAVSPTSAIIIGFVSGLVMLLTSHLLEKCKIDDVVGAVPTHLSAGIWGTLAVAIFGKPELLGTGLTRFEQFQIQCLGILMCFVIGFCLTYVILFIFNKFYPLRVSVEAEKSGLNIAEHNASTEILDFFQSLQKQIETQDLSLRVPVETNTEIGQIAFYYNQLLDKLESAVARTRLIVSNAKDGVVTFVNQNMVINSVNPAAAQILHCSSESLLGQPLTKFLDLKGKTNLNNFSDEVEGTKADGSKAIISIGIQKIKTITDEFYACFFKDVTEVNKARAKLHHLANYDSLTGIPNREHFLRKLKENIKVLERTKGTLGLLLIDVDNFKNVNDTFGHPVGDVFLQEIASLLRAQVRETDFIARFSGDEFFVMLTNVEDPLYFGKVGAKILQALNKKHQIENHIIHSSVSIGIATYPDSSKLPEELIKFADIALYKGKNDGRSQMNFFSEKLGSDYLTQSKIESHLHGAIKNKEFFLLYQPICFLTQQKLVGVEALIRWNNPELGLVTPEQFIPIAERTELIVSIGEWVFREACEQFKRWQDQDGFCCKISINVSPVQLVREDFPEMLHKIILAKNVPAEYIELELTETAVMSHLKGYDDVLDRLRQIGFKIAIDDFGTGYSSLERLRDLSVNTLKIDRSFLKELTTSEESSVIVESILALAQKLKLDVVAEGIETETQMNTLTQKNCALGQGYFFDKPVSSEYISKIMKTNSKKD